jgi:spore germination protein
MYRRLTFILFPIMTLAFIGTAMWGYQENQEKNAILIKAENQYQRAFHDLSYHMEQLHSEIGKTIAVNSDASDYYRRGLSNVWRLSSEAQNEINQLPLTLLPFNNTEEFLSNISSFSYRTAVRDLTKSPLTPEEKDALAKLYQRSDEIKNELQTVQTKVLNQNLRWMDVETALATQDKQLDNTIVDGFKTVDKKVSEYGEFDLGPSMASLHQKRNYSALGGMEITAEEAKQKAAQFIQATDPNSLQVTENGAGTEYTSYSVKGKNPYYGQDMQMDLTKKGGHVIYYMATRDVQEKTIDMMGARQAAEEYLQAHGYPDMAPVNYDEYQNVASFTFAHKVGDVTVYPEKIVVKVALDDAEVTGLQASDYLYEHKERQFAAPAMSKEQAVKELNPSFKKETESLAWISNDLDQEVLCYEFTGRINDKGYRIYINADTGMEEKIEEFQDPSKS